MANNLFKKFLKYFIFIFDFVRNYYHQVVLYLILKLNNSPKESKNWVIYAQNSRNIDDNAGMMCIIYFLMKSGWHAEPAYSRSKYSPFGKIYNSEFKNFSINERFFLSEDNNYDSLLDKFSIDIFKKEILFEGINFFDLIETSLVAKLKCFRIDYNNSETKLLFDSLLLSLSHALRLCKRISEISNNKNISILCIDPQSMPNAVFNIYFNKHSQHNVKIYLFGNSYRTYHNKGSIYGNTYMLNKIKKNYLHYYYVNKNEYDFWAKNCKEENFRKIEEFGKNIIEVNRYFKTFAKDPNHEETIAIAKKNNTPIFCLFAHLCYDRPLYDRTECFFDMVDWVEKTIKLLENQDCLLLIKPHVMEHVLSSSKRPNQRLNDIFSKKKYGKNIIFLDSNEYTSFEIFSFIDYSLIWRSTAFIESLYHLKPSLYCGPMSSYSEVLINYKISNLADYSIKLEKLKKQKVTFESRERALSVLYYLNYVKIFKINIFNELPNFLGKNVIINPLKLINYMFDKNNSNSEYVKTIMNQG